MKPIIIKEGNVAVRIYARVQHKRGVPYKSFQVADCTSGKRKLVAFAEERDARTFAGDIAIKLANLDGAVLKLTSEDRLIYLRAVDALKSTGRALDQVAAEFAEAHKRLGGRSVLEAVDYFIKQHPVELPKRTVAQVVDELIADKRRAGLSARHIGDLDARLKKFKADFSCQIADVTGGMIKAWIQAQKREDGNEISNRSRNNFRLAIQTLFSFAKAEKYLARDWAEMDAVPTWKDEDNEIEIFTPAELSTLLSAADDKLIPFLVIGAFAGMRSAEISRLDWSKVNFKTSRITVDASIAKTNSRRVITIPDNLKAWLAPFAKAKGKVIELENIPNAVQRLIDSLRPAGPTVDGKRPSPVVEWKHNALRHSFCTYRLALKPDLGELSYEAGNSPRMLKESYNSLSDDKAAAEAWFAIMPE